MYELFLGNRTAWKVLRVLAEAPGKGVKREKLRRLCRAGNLALTNALRRLELFGIIEKSKRRKAHIYRLKVNRKTRTLIALVHQEQEYLRHAAIENHRACFWNRGDTEAGRR